MKRPMSTMTGSARPMVEMPRARKSPRCLWPSQRPTGKAITMPIPSAVKASSASSTALTTSKWAWSGMKRRVSRKSEASISGPGPMA